MKSFLNNISIQFKNNHFFACSAFGHKRDKGEYKPEDVLSPMEWLFKNADPKMGQLWHNNTFSKKTINVEE